MHSEMISDSGVLAERTVARPTTAAHRLRLAGTAVDVCTAEHVLTEARSMLAGGPGGALRVKPLLVGSVNLDHIHHFSRATQGETAAVRHGSGWLMTLDGAPVVWAASRLTGARAPRLTGADLLPGILGVAAQGRHRIGFLGGTTQARAQLAPVLRRQFPGIELAGHWTPGRSVVDSVDASRELAANIRAEGVDLLVVGLGKPRQEVWLERHAAHCGIRVGLAFGAAADFLAGTARRAPQWAQDNGLEWLYRLSREPRRLARRYLVQGPAALASVAADLSPRALMTRPAPERP